MKLILLLFLFAVALNITAEAQKKLRSNFAVFEEAYGATSGNVAAILDKLNMKIAKLTRVDSVELLINKSMLNYKNIRLKIREQMPGNVVRYYDFISGNPKENKVSTIHITGAKALKDETIYYDSQFARVFNNLVIIDTAAIKIIPKDYPYKIDSFFIKSPATPYAKIFLPSNHKDILYLLPGPGDSSGNEQHYSLYNEADSSSGLSGFSKRSIYPQEKAMLLNIAALLINNDEEKKLKIIEVADHLQQYALQNIGFITLDNLVMLINKEIRK